MLAALEAHLRAHPTDIEAWRVYADALLERDEVDLAAAVRDGLGGGRAARIPAPDGTDVAWRMGLWRAVSVPDRGRLAAVLAHPAARLVEHVVLPLGAVDPGLLVSVPGLRRVDVTDGDGARDGLAVLGAALGKVEEIRWSGRIRAAPVAPALRRLVADSVPDWRGADLPLLEQLELLDPEDGELRGLARADGLPALRALAVRSQGQRRISVSVVNELLAGGLGRGLRRVEVPAVPDPAVRDRTELVVVDTGDSGSAASGVRVRAVHYASDEDYVRMAPPTSPLEAELAFLAAVEDVGGTVRHLDALEDDAWIGVPAGWARTIAARMAVVAGAPAQQLVVQTATVAGPSGRVRQVAMSAAAWEIGPDGASAPVRLEETGREATASVGGWEGDEDQHEVVQELLSELLGERTGLSVWLPVGWRPDPLGLAGAVVGPVPVRIGARTLAPELGQYVVWRLRWVGGLAPGPVPDVARWTERLLRRHGLERPPADEAHPYWAEWVGRTREERARRAADKDRVAAHKLTAPGRWLLVGDEAEVLARWLCEPIDHHRPQLELGQVVAALRGDSGAGEVEVEVR